MSVPERCFNRSCVKVTSRSDTVAKVAELQSCRSCKVAGVAELQNYMVGSCLDMANQTIGFRLGTNSEQNARIGSRAKFRVGKVRCRYSPILSNPSPLKSSDGCNKLVMHRLNILQIISVAYSTGVLLNHNRDWQRNETHGLLTT